MRFLAFNRKIACESKQQCNAKFKMVRIEVGNKIKTGKHIITQTLIESQTDRRLPVWLGGFAKHSSEDTKLYKRKKGFT